MEINYNNVVNSIIMDTKFFRFLIVGSINTIFGYLMFVLFIAFNFHYTIAVLLATILGILFNFKTTGKLVFESHDDRLLFKFVEVYSLLYVLNITALSILKSYQVDMYLAGTILLLPMAFISYLLNKKFVFKDSI